MAMGIVQGNSDIILDRLIEEGARFDLILTDPPYNLNKDFGNNSDSLTLDEFLRVTTERIDKCKKLLSDRGSIIWFGIHKYIGFIQCIMYKLGLHYRRLNIWFYENGFSRYTNAPIAQYEPFLWYSVSDTEWVYNLDKVRVPYKSIDRLKNPIYYINGKGEKVKWEPNPLGSMRGDVWSFPTLAGKAYKKEKTSHPTQKPEALITEIIKAFCPIDNNGSFCGSILDPFHGSGTLGVCCEKLNLQGNKIDWMGIELEEKWCNIANERLERIKNDKV